MKFSLQGQDANSKARAGILVTDHGQFETPVFMPVGTLGGVKAVLQKELEEEINAKIILVNTYHLYLRPGLDILKKSSGIHNFINWKGPILTDSGGYQVYSLAEKRKITKEGVTFQSHIDGAKHFFSPENIIDIQRTIGADIIMAFDECTPYPCDKKYATESMDLTHQWLEKCCNHFKKSEPLYDYDQTLFPIVQGSVYKDLRKISAEKIASCDMSGNAIGGLSVGEPTELLYEMTEIVCDILPNDKPRYLMGVGTPVNLLECIALGIDMFDCVMPTRNARNGMLFTSEGIINIKNEKWKNDLSPIDKESKSNIGQSYSKAYIRHLMMAKEILGAQLASILNLSLYLDLVGEARKHILEGDFNSWKQLKVKQLDTRL